VQLPSLNTGSLGADALGSAERTVDASRRFGLLGAAIAVAGFALQAVVVVSNSGALTAIRDGNLSDLILFIPFAIGAAGLAVIVLRRSWIAASTKPFNYTVSVEPIEHLEPDGTTRGTFARIDGIRRLDWLGTDLTEMLSDQVSRFSWVDESELDKSDPSTCTFGAITPAVRRTGRAATGKFRSVCGSASGRQVRARSSPCP
jgi:hypothetical protein